jgi:AraC-like DNA-binding protein
LAATRTVNCRSRRSASRAASATPAIRRSLDWIDANIGAANPVMAMADASGLTRRTFARRFRAATGKRPIEYVHALRIERARQLIETGAGPVDDVGYRVGYEDPTFFRRLFRRAIGLTPAAYRRKYARIVPLGPWPDPSDGPSWRSGSDLRGPLIVIADTDNRSSPRSARAIRGHVIALRRSRASTRPGASGTA